MSKENRLVTLIRQQINVEKEHVENLVDLRKKVGNAAARLLLLEMRLDSEKHVSILNEMLEILKEIPLDTTLWDHELEEYIGEAIVEKEFKENVTKENSALEHLKEELKHSKDESIKLLFQNIDEDEKKQNRTLKTMVENLYRTDRPHRQATLNPKKSER
jgi:rubrerythrin